MPRFEIPALIVVDADNEHEAIQNAQRMTATVNQDVGPGAFFPSALAVIELPRKSEGREDETVDEHAASLESAAAVSA
jgi:hypothetical protein